MLRESLRKCKEILFAAHIYNMEGKSATQLVRFLPFDNWKYPDDSEFHNF